MLRAVANEVLIVGAGPTGLMLANQLVRNGVRPRIIDRHAGPARETRALGVQARTLEIYAHLEIADAALQLGKRATGANLWAGGRRSARIPVGDIGQDISPFPFLLILGQDDNERLLGDALRERGVSIEWNTELVRLAQHDDRVDVGIKRADGTVSDTSASWVAGCDGAHSAVRHLNGIEFQGAPYEHVFFVADVVATGSMVPSELNAYLWEQGFHLFFPMRGSDHWRLVGILPSELRDRTNLTFDEVVPHVRREAGAELQFRSCSWFSTYRIHHRRAARFRDRRCFLLGDAAHVHSPVGAQGMNTGLQDAYNLAWKLALVVSERADQSLLDSYADERVPVAERLLHTTDRAFSLLVSDGWLSGVFRTRVLARIAAFAMTRERVRKLAFMTISQTGISYRDGPLARTTPGWPEGAPRAGDRFPWLRVRINGADAVEDLYARLDDTKFTLIECGAVTPPTIAEPFGDSLRRISVAADSVNAPELARVGIPVPSAFLLRPDGHIGLAAVKLDAAAIRGYAADRLHFESSESSSS